MEVKFTMPIVKYLVTVAALNKVQEQHNFTYIPIIYAVICNFHNSLFGCYII